LGPRPALLLALAAIVLASVGAFGYVLLDSPAQSRREAEKRFDERARISAALTAAIFTASAGQRASGRDEGVRRANG